METVLVALSRRENILHIYTNTSPAARQCCQWRYLSNTRAYLLNSTPVSFLWANAGFNLFNAFPVYADIHV